MSFLFPAVRNTPPGECTHFPTKTAAREWEDQVRADRTEAPNPTPSTSLLAWANDYLAFAVRYVPKTFSDKRTVFRRLFAVMDPQTDIRNVTVRDALDFLQKQFLARSGSRMP